MNAILFSYFGWPYGAVYSNLLASLICALLVWWRLRARMILHHAEQLAQQERHHRALKDHITKAAAVPPAAIPIEQMSDAEFEKQLRALMRRDPKVLEAFIRNAERKSGRTMRRQGGDRM